MSKNRKNLIQRVAMTLLALVLTSASAWAAGDISILTGSETELSEGTYLVNSNITFNNKITLKGDVIIILADGKTMNVGTSEAPIHDDYAIKGTSGASLDIYGQSLGTGTLHAYADRYDPLYLPNGNYTQHGGNVYLSSTYTESTGLYASHDAYTKNAGNVTLLGGLLNVLATGDGSKAIYAKKDVNILGGSLDAQATGAEHEGNSPQGIYSMNGSITLGYTNAGDQILASSYYVNVNTFNPNGAVQLKDGQALTDGTNTYNDQTTSATLAALTNVTLRPVTYAVSFDINYEDGTSPTSQTIAHGLKATEPSVAARTGYTFNGWKNGEDDYDFDAAVTSDLNLTAKWNPITYTVQFDKNSQEASGVMADMNLTYDGDWTALTAFDFTVPDGKAFKNWNTAADGSGDSYDNEQFVRNLTTENGATVTLYAQWGKDIACCTTTVPDQALDGYSYIYYKFESANYGNVTIGEEVYDGNTKLTLKTDYEFGSVKYLDGTSGTAKTNEPGEEMLVEIKGIGNYAGSKWVNFMITTPDESGEWGDLTWNLHEGTLTINKKDGVEGNVTMQAANQGEYTWFQYGQYITSISIGEGVLNIADNAFAGSHNVNTYGNVKSVSFPSTLTKIGEDAFAFCTGATIDIDQIITIFKNNNSGIENIDPTAFYQVRCVSCTMESSDNTAIIGLMLGTQTANVTINGRTLKKDGSWNTLCLPFDIDLLAKNDNDEYICPLNGAVIMEMDDTSDGTNFNSGTGVLKLKFKSIIGNEMTHGKPYLVKWTKPDGYDDNPASFDIVDPTFTGVTNIGNNLTVVTSKDGSVTFNGTYLPYTGSVEALLKESDNSTALDAFHAFVKVYDKSTYIVEGVYEDEQFQTSANTLKELDHDNIMKYYAKINEADPVATYYVDENGTTHNVEAYELEESRTTLTTGTYVVNRDITFENTVKLNGDVTLILSDGHKMQIGKTGQNLFDGIVFEGENDESLTIYGQSDGTGKLVIDIVKENGYCIAANNISINSGTVDVKNLGSGYDIYGNDVQIKGGQVNATGFMDNIYSNGPLTISGGTVTVASIAPGNGNLTCVHAQNITISGGIVNITPSDKTSATYIGLNSKQDIIISGGQVTVNTNTNFRSIYAPNGTITLGYTRSDDFVWANSYSAVTIAQGKTMSDGTDTYSGALGYGTIDGKTMRPYKDDLILAVDADNTQSINGWNGGITNVTLTGLTLYKDGKWHTLCLPFDVKDSDYDPDKVWYNYPGGEDELACTGSPLKGFTLMELDNEGFYNGTIRYTYDEGKGGYYDEDGYDYGGDVAELRHTGLNTDGTLRLCFIKAYEIKAGKPYLIKWNNTGDDDIVEPIFSKVLINNTVDDNVVSQDGEVMFVGSYKPYVSTGDAFLTDADVSHSAFHVAIIAPQRTGYVFGDWFAEPECNTPVNEISLSVNNSVELYPLWTLITRGNCGQTGTDGSDVTWSYDESSKTITISGTGAMMYYGLTDDFKHSTSPWSHLDGELEHVIIQDGVTSVGSYAFAMCSKLTDVVLPTSMFQIDQNAFYTSSLNRIIIPRTEAVSVAQNAFDYCPEGLSIVVPSTLLKTYKNADNWSTYSDKLVGSLSEVTGFNTTDFVSGRYEFKRTFKCGVSSTICLPFAVPAAQAASVGKFYSFDGIDKSGQQWTVIMKEDVNEVTNGLEANKPYLFVPYIFDGMSHGDAFEFTFSGSVSSPEIAGSIKQENENGSSWTFQGVFYNILWDETHNSGMLGKVYGFAANSYSPDDNSYTVNPGDFVKAGEGASMPSFRAFLQYTGSSAQNAPMRGGTRADVSLPNSMKVKLIDANGTITATGEISTETADFIIDTWYDMNGRILPDAPTTPGMYIHNGNQVLIKY